MRRTGYQRKEIRGSAAGRPGRVRLIAGRFRGRRIAVAPVPGLRPTPERTRETLFNWLQGRIEGARVLDLFAGSGALGFEALSRGADRVVLVEQDRAAHATLQRTAAELDPERTEAVRDDALRWPRVAAEAFDLVFLDPPFAAGLAVAALARLGSAVTLATDARVYCEVRASSPPPWETAAAGAWEVVRETRAGDSRAALLRQRPPRVHVSGAPASVQDPV